MAEEWNRYVGYAGALKKKKSWFVSTCWGSTTLTEPASRHDGFSASCQRWLRRCEDEKMRRWEDVKMRRCEVRRCEDEKMWRWEGVNMRRCEDEKVWRWEDVKMRRCEDEKMWRWEGVKIRRCEDEKVWSWEGVKMRRCEDEKVWRWEDVKMRRCEDEKMWRWEGVKLRRCEDEKMWRWEGVKMRRCEDEKMRYRPHYWKNPALRRSREWTKNTRTEKQENENTNDAICRSLGHCDILDLLSFAMESLDPHQPQAAHWGAGWSFVHHKKQDVWPRSLPIARALQGTSRHITHHYTAFWTIS